MPRSKLELVRSLVEGFSEVNFGTFRDALAEARDIDGVAEIAGPYGELVREALDPEVEVKLHGIRVTSMIGDSFRGLDGWLEFWRSWLEPWDDYSVEFTDWEEIGDTVLYRLGIEARGRGSGAKVRDRIVQAWTVDQGKVARLDMYPSMRSARADLRRR